MKRLAIISFLLVGAIGVQSATIHVPTDQPTIQAGIDTAANGDTVLVASGTYFESLTLVSKSVHIVSAGGATLTHLQWVDTLGMIFDNVAAGSFVGFTLGSPQPVYESAITVRSANIHFGENVFSDIKVTRELFSLSSNALCVLDHNVFSRIDAPNVMVAISDSAIALFTNNSIDSTQRAVAAYTDGCVLRNNIFANCYKWAVFNNGAVISEDYNDFWNNTADYFGNSIDPTDIEVDPQWVDVASGDYSLSISSPCIDAGHPGPQYFDPDSTRNDIGALFYRQCDSTDIDADGLIGCDDNCPNDYNPGQEDFDSDGTGDVCDPCPFDPDNDFDSDGLCGDIDNCPNAHNPGQEDSDGDGTGDACDICPGFDDSADADSDGIPDSCDICPGFDDAIDSDGDGVPDGCDMCEGVNDSLDTDADGVPDNCDMCPGFDDAADDDSDGAPDSCDICPGFDDFADFDGDGAPDSCDNCPTLFNASQSDADGDGIGNSCDMCPFDPENDTDADSVCAGVDNCPTDYNPGQEDTNGDGVGDACCCVGQRGDVNGDGLSAPDIVDLSYLIDFLWQGGDTPPCPNGADLNGQDGTDIVDITFLVDFLWQGGPPPPPCP
ncbi:MAG: thrombospondin type 3 repeat-containing protein [Candidatus Zixiibacteriota bacterium]